MQKTCSYHCFRGSGHQPIMCQHGRYCVINDISWKWILSRNQAINNDLTLSYDNIIVVNTLVSLIIFSAACIYWRVCMHQCKNGGHSTFIRRTLNVKVDQLCI